MSITENSKKGLPISWLYRNTIANEKGGPFYGSYYLAHSFPKIITHRKIAIICHWEVTKETETRKEQGRMTLL